MCRNNMGNPKRKSRFICLRCLHENLVGQGVQRRGHRREKYHIKDMVCNCTKFSEETKNIEVRDCDSFMDMMEKAKELHEKYYGQEIPEKITT